MMVRGGVGAPPSREKRHQKKGSSMKRIMLAVICLMGSANMFAAALDIAALGEALVAVGTLAKADQSVKKIQDFMLASKTEPVKMKKVLNGLKAVEVANKDILKPMTQIIGSFAKMNLNTLLTVKLNLVTEKLNKVTESLNQITDLVGLLELMTADEEPAMTEAVA